MNERTRVSERKGMMKKRKVKAHHDRKRENFTVQALTMTLIVKMRRKRKKK